MSEITPVNPNPRDHWETYYGQARPEARDTVFRQWREQNPGAPLPSWAKGHLYGTAGKAANLGQKATHQINNTWAGAPKDSIFAGKPGWTVSDSSRWNRTNPQIPTPGGASAPKYVDKKGYGENYYEKNAYRWTQPPPAATYWNDVGGQFNDPWAGETGIANTLGEMNSLGVLESGLGDFQSRLRGPTATGDVFSRLSAKGPGAMENFWEQSKGQLSGPSTLTTNRDQVLNDIEGARNLEDFWDATNEDLKRPGYTENLADQYRPEFSYSEDLLLGGGGLAGLDDLYARESELGGRRLDDRAAAGGGFNSGAALAARGELERDLSARKIQDVIGLTNQADTQKMARLGYGLDLMTGADEGLRGRIGLGFQGGEAVDRISLARAEALQNLFQGEGDEMRSNLALGGTLANNAQSASTAFDTLLMNSGRAKDDVFKNLMELENTSSRDAQNAWQQRLNGQLTGASLLDGLKRNRIELGGNLAATAGDQSLNYLDSGMTAAIGADTGQLNRRGQQYDQIMGYIQEQIAVHARNFDAQAKEEWDAFTATLYARLQRGEINAEEAMGQAKEYAKHMENMTKRRRTNNSGGEKDGGEGGGGGGGGGGGLLSNIPGLV